MEKEIRITPEQIRNMSETEWNEYRMKSWLNKREYYSQDLPEWYLKDKERFITFIERVNSKRR